MDLFSELGFGDLDTVETGYKNIVGSRKTCSYNRFLLYLECKVFANQGAI